CMSPLLSGLACIVAILSALLPTLHAGRLRVDGHRRSQQHGGGGNADRATAPTSDRSIHGGPPASTLSRRGWTVRQFRSQSPAGTQRSDQGIHSASPRCFPSSTTSPWTSRRARSTGDDAWPSASSA